MKVLESGWHRAQIPDNCFEPLTELDPHNPAMPSSLSSVTTLTINGELADTPAATLADLVVELGHDAASVATAVNGEFVARKARGERRLAPGDAVEIVAPRQGG